MKNLYTPLLAQFVISLLYMHRQHIHQSWFSVIIAVQHILLWSKLHYFAR